MDATNSDLRRDFVTAGIAGTALTAEAVLIDLDSTLVDSSQALVRCWGRWMREFGVTDEEFSAVVAYGLTSAAVVAALLPTGQVPAALRRIEQLEALDVDGVLALPGARAFTEALPEDRWAVVTSGTTAVATARLAAAGLSTPTLVTADDVRRGKPDPEPYLLGAHRLGVDPARCVVIEDAPAGLASARGAGMRSIAVTTSHPADALDADLIIEGLHELRVDLDAGVLAIRPTDRA